MGLVLGLQLNDQADKDILGSMEQTLLGGRYQVVRRLGSGGFSRTFLVTDIHLPNHPRCVIKQLKVQDKDTGTLDMARRLFDTEARVLYQLGNHPQIPALMAHFEEGQEFYLAQEYIEGSRLNRQVEEGKPWSETRVVLLLQEVLEILSFVHRQQVIHRDVKPSNLIRRHRDGKLVLIDFGAVKQVTSSPLLDAETGATNITVAIGTHGYMPNEQYAGKPRFSSDVYAVGILGIRALTGIHPQKIEEDPITSELSWRHHAPTVSSSLAAVLDKMVRYDFRDRYPTAQEALEALQNLPNPLHGLLGTQIYQTWMKGANGRGPTFPGDDSDTAVGPTETSEPTAFADDQESTSLFPVDLAYGASGAVPLVSSDLAVEELKSHRHRSMVVSSLIGAISLLVLWRSGLTIAFEPTPGAAVPFQATAIPTLTTDFGLLLPPEEKAVYLTRQGDRLRYQGRYPDALVTYNQAVESQPDYAPAYLGRCRALIALKRPLEAIVACDDALAYSTYYPEAVRSKGNAEEQQGKLLAALELYESTNRQMPAMFEAWLDRGRVLQKLGRSAEAIAAIDQAIARNRESVEAWTVRGEATWDLQRYDQSIIALEKALQIDPDYGPAKELRKRARQTLGR
ncbi:serine/threonine-protein kinase [Nodosilinea sp. FACHB-13]|uniref:serine/threonine-protein kinase n=1 Tax=Cyanophyceae TaxID=3028117 RepID=UPI0016865244|nr:serine/threonine-protein kinase [Nodosilinea sp. FACHB-13]MBD2107188.1 tetratricopeptide repeat protein [Nodosilinea sp. FACHB-13]